jgi:FtsZ-binding cell division protein ZapB
MSFYRGIIMSENTNFTKAELIDIIRLKNKEIEQLNEKCTDLENENQQYHTSNFYLEEENNSLYTRIEKLVKHNNMLEDQLYSLKLNVKLALKTLDI